MKTIIVLLLMAASVCAAPVPPALAPDPLGVPTPGLYYYAGNTEEYEQPRMTWSTFQDGDGMTRTKLVVSNVRPGTLAYENGFRDGDHLLKFQGESMENSLHDYFGKVKLYRPGAVLTYTVERNGNEVELKVKMGAEKVPEPVSDSY